MDKRDLKINTLEANYKTMAEKFDDLKDAVNEGFIGISKDIKSFREECDKKYASKKTETTVDNLTWLVLSTVVLAGLAIIFIK